jgi:hypothetical protein
MANQQNIKEKWGRGAKLVMALIFVFIVAVLCNGLIDIYVRYNGEERLAEVSQTFICNRKSPSIKVRLDEVEYSLRITKSDCFSGKYRVGKKVTVLKHPYFDRVVWPNYKPLISFGFIFLFMAAVFFYVRYQRRKA